MNSQFDHLKPPSTNLQDVLLHVVKFGSVSMINFPTMGGYRTRVSELGRLGVRFVKIPSEGLKNKHGHPMSIPTHKCTNRTFAESLYKQLTDEKSKLKASAKE